MLLDAGQHNKCIADYDQLVAVVEYRESVCEKFEKDHVTQEPTTGGGFKWPWQK